MADYKAITDHELAILLSQGDRKAYTEIYHRYWAVMFRQSLKIVRDEAEAGDIVQDIFASLWNNREVFLLTGPLSSYFYVAVRNKTLDVLSRSKVRLLYLDSLSAFIDMQHDDLHDELMVKELRQQIEEQIGRLPEKMRTVFELSRKSHLSHKEIASKLSISEATVKKQIGRAIKLLRFHLDLIILLFYLSGFR